MSQRWTGPRVGPARRELFDHLVRRVLKAARYSRDAIAQAHCGHRRQAVRSAARAANRQTSLAATRAGPPCRHAAVP